MSGVIQISDSRSAFRSILLFFLMVISVSLYAQTDKKYIRKGNREYDKSKYSDSEIFYRKAVDKNNQSPDALFNIGDALYKQNKFEEAGNQFIENANQTNDKVKKSAGLYNLGNSLLKANKVQESIEAYKNSLILRPDNPEAKYNLSYAQDLLKQQQQQQQQQQSKDQNKDNKNNDKNKKDQNKNKDDNNKDQQQNQDKKEAQNQDQKQQQSDKQEISQEDAQRLLNSMANDEKKVQEKVKLAKAQKAKTRSVKNW
jgi:Ca-activated chloride channel homolog